MLALCLLSCTSQHNPIANIGEIIEIGPPPSTTPELFLQNSESNGLAINNCNELVLAGRVNLP